MARVTDNQDGTLTIMLTPLEQKYFKWSVAKQLSWFEVQIGLLLDGASKDEFLRRFDRLPSPRRSQLLNDMDAIPDTVPRPPGPP